jgi:hypothetical protein
MTPLALQLIDVGLDDIIQLSEIVDIAHFDLGVPEGEGLYSAVAEALRELLDGDLAIVGDLFEVPPPLHVVPWSGEPAAIVRRVIDEWRALGRRPGLSQVCWLSLTPAGRDFRAQSSI